MQGNPRKIAWISLDPFGRNGSFQRVTREKIKKFPSAKDPPWLQSPTHRTRELIVAERVAVEFLMAEIITGLSP
jgi:hypothetical protein